MTNTTPGRAAPARISLLFEVAVSYDGDSCRPGACENGFLIAKPVGNLWNPDSFGGVTPTVPVSATVELQLDDRTSPLVPEEVTLEDGFWWRAVAGEGSTDMAWVAVGGATGAPPAD